ncbi:MAG: discoidin domain-containing protein, partial [Armatimonadetes bacterium]|nr:discoidin domain-containing protein [Armatimonadota bacterium]
MMVRAALLLVVTACLGAPENLALNRPYTLTPAPNYSPCIDPGDATQLTDGVRTAGHFWTRPSTVGWSGVSLRMITIDLGQVQPIAGASFSTAAGVADVGWPESIALLVSEDNQTYHLLGDLVQLTDGGAPPAEGGYRTFTYQTTALSTRGRYVRLAVQAGGQYLFVDEIEVFKGAPEAAAQPAAGIRLPGDNFLFAMRYVRRQELDRVALRGRIESSTVAAEIRQKLLAELTEAGEALRRPESVADPASFRAIPPYDEPHRRLFALHGKLLAAEGQPPLAVWHKYRYAPLGLFEPPAAAPPRLAARLLRGEHRAE